jgi:mono/diheme cytochrome c family protein
MKSLFYLGAASALLLTGFRSVYNSAQPPVASTGAPGESTCIRCHSGTPLNGGGGSVTLSGLPRGGYQPGVVYSLTVQVTDVAMSRFGFELQAQNTANNSAAGTLTVVTATNTVVRPNGTKSYVSHRNASTNSSWTFNWTAPATGAPTVKFYVAGVAANASNSDRGDHVYTTNTTLIAEPTGLSSTEAAADVLNFFPNPTAERITLSGSALAKAHTLLLYDAIGRLVRQQAPAATLDLHDLPAGRYTLSILGADDHAVSRTLVVRP